MNWFYKTFENDADIISQLFWFKITNQDWAQTAWFLESSTNYFDRLEEAGYSYVSLELSKDWNISVLRKNEWEKTLDLNVPVEIFQWLLEDIQRICDRYKTSLRLIQPIDLPFTTWNKENIESESIPFEKITK